MSYVIRKMTLDDLEQVVAIDQVSFSLPWPARSFQFELTDNPASRCWVADVDGRIVGMVVAWLIVDEIHIATIATHPDFRRQGIGKEFTFAYIEICESRRRGHVVFGSARRQSWLRWKCIVNLVLWKAAAARGITRIMMKLRS